MTNNKASAQTQIISAIKYIKSDFPLTYQAWKQQLKGHKEFEKHLNTLDFTLTTDKYSSLKNKIFDELLIKFRFIAKNQSYLQNFEVFLLQKFIRLVVRELSNLYKLSDIYSIKQVPNKQQTRKQLWQRYVILFDCLTSLLKYCFVSRMGNQVHTQNSDNQHKFSNQMILKSSSQTSKEEITSKGFVAFVLQILSQKIDEIFMYDIIAPEKVYPQVFSILSEGYLNFRGGSKVLELISNILSNLIRKNVKNIWADTNKESNSVALIDSLIEKLNKEVINVMKRNKSEEQQTDMKKTKNCANKLPKQGQNQKTQKASEFSQISKQRLVLFLQRLLLKIGYQSQGGQFPQNSIQSEQFLSGNKRTKISKFISSLITIVEKATFDIAIGQTTNVHTISSLVNLCKTDEKILENLVILSIEFMDQQPHPLDHSPTQNSKQQKQQPSSLITLLSLHTYSHPILSSINTKLNSIFMSKFSLLLNKNKTISSSKTSLLKQLSKLIKFINFNTLTHDEFQSLICLKLKQLFSPNQFELNKPMIISIDQQKSGTGGQVNGQAIPLTELGPHHSFLTYPVRLEGLIESMRCQEGRHVLDEVKLFGWFEHQEGNLEAFRNMINGMEITGRVRLLEYFMCQVLSRKLQQTTASYSLEMSLSQFYQLLINYFFIDTILNTTTLDNCHQQQRCTSLLSLSTYKRYKQLYSQQIMPKLQSLHSMIQNNSDIKKLLISTKEEELLVFYHIKIFYSISRFFLAVQDDKSRQLSKPLTSSRNNRLKTLYKESIIAQYLILNLSQSTYLLKLLVTSCLLQFSAPLSINQLLKPLQSTLIHRNAGSSHAHKPTNLQFMRNLISISILSPKCAQQLASIYLSKSFIANPQSNKVISLIFRQLSPQTMRKCILSIRNWPVIFSIPQNIQLLNNQPLLSQGKEQMFSANDGDNVTVSNALGVVVLELNEKWTAELQFTNPRKQVLIDAMVNLIGVNDRLIFWKRFFFENVLVKLISILKEIQGFVRCDTSTSNNNNNNNSNNNSSSSKSTNFQSQQKGRRHVLYERIHSKIFCLLSMIPVQYFKYSTQINAKIRQTLQTLKFLVEKQYQHLKRQCFVYQRYDQYLDKYKLTNAILDKIEAGLNYKQDENDLVYTNSEGNEDIAAQIVTEQQTN